jgi:hypothetical protein
MSSHSLFFPEEPRSFAGRRVLKILLRAVHVLCAGVLTGAFLLDSAAASGNWVTATLASGIAILLLDLHESGVFLLQLRGWFVIVKLGGVAVVPRIDSSAATWLLCGLLVGSVLSSHASSGVRYFIPLGRGRFRGARTKG